MRNALLATASLAFVSSPALAADKLSVGVGGYMQQWVGMSSVDDTTEKVSDGTAQQSDSEIFFKGSLEADNGLTFSVKVELEGNSGKAADGKRTGVIDESQLTVGGEFGKVTLGAEDPASTLMHYGGLDVGVSLNCGDTHKWIGGLAGCSHNGFGTYGHGHGDKNQITYFTPRMNGVQLGATYIPDRTQEGGNNALNDNETDAWAVGANYAGDLGEDLSVSLSLGHYQGSQTGAAMTIFDGMKMGKTAREAGFLVVASDAGDAAYTATPNEATIKAYRKAVADVMSGKTIVGEDMAGAAATAQSRLDDYQTSMMKADDKTFSNAAMQLGMGGFAFTVAYAANDGGAYKVAPANVDLTKAQFDATSLGMQTGVTSSAPVAGGLHVYDKRGNVGYDANNDGDFTDTGDGEYAPVAGGNKYSIAVLTAADTTSTNPRVHASWKAGEAIPGGYFIVEEGEVYGATTGDSTFALLNDAGDNIAEADQMTHNDAANDDPMGRMDKIVDDKSQSWDTWGVGVKYSDGPMAVSLSHLATEWDDGGEQEGTMLSVSYTLAPGVASKSSIFTAERSFANGRDIEGTGFVTGITVGF